MLLRTRQLLLEAKGHEVTSALGFQESMEHCKNLGNADLLLLGHSIPYTEKLLLIAIFQAHHQAPVIAIESAHEPLIDGADITVSHLEPEQLIAVVDTICSERKTR